MSARNSIRRERREAGIALLISIFILLLISVVAIALLVSSGTESAIAGNYRAATAVYYAALAGLEEGRGRLLRTNPNYFNNSAPGFIPSPGPLAVGDVRYITNPVGAEDVLTAYLDTEYAVEFGSNPTNVSTISSVSTVAGIQGPLYKWVRINGVSEQSLGLDTYPYDGSIDPTPVYFDGTHLSDINSGTQVLEITALAVLPNGSQKLLQYLAAPIPITFTLPPFLAALTIAGSSTNGVAFTPPTANSSYYASGVDLTSVPSCAAGPAVHAIGVLNGTDVTNVISGGNGGTGIPSGMQSQYQGTARAPDVADVSGSFPANLQTPSQLDRLAKSIIDNADVIITPSGGTAYGSDLTNLINSPILMSSSNPVTVVVNGNLDLNDWHNTGSGLLLVTGNLNYNPDASWQGIVLVIGQGTVTGSKNGSGQFAGAMLVAQTRDPSTGFATLLPDPDLGMATVLFASHMGGSGFRYSSCWIQKSQPTSSYKILSFHEISQ